MLTKQGLAFDQGTLGDLVKHQNVLKSGFACTSLVKMLLKWGLDFCRLKKQKVP